MILVFDTSTSHLAIGMADDAGALLREFHADASDGSQAGSTAPRGIHDARLASETAALLDATGTSPDAIERIGLIIGPGSFTGLRIGLSFAKGLALATGAGIVALTQHEVIAAEVTQATLIVTASYRDDSFYVAEAASPREIRLVSKEELSSSFILHPSSLSLKTLARLAAASGEVVRGEAIDGLEPLYLTEFKTGAR